MHQCSCFTKILYAVVLLGFLVIFSFMDLQEAYTKYLFRPPGLSLLRNLTITSFFCPHFYVCLPYSCGLWCSMFEDKQQSFDWFDLSLLVVFQWKIIYTSNAWSLKVYFAVLTKLDDNNSYFILNFRFNNILHLFFNFLDGIRRRYY